MQNCLFIKTEEAQKKQTRVDELLRENAKFRTKLKDMKCPICLNGERIPPQLQQGEKKKEEVFKPKPIVRKIKKAKEESDEDDPETLARIKQLERG